MLNWPPQPSHNTKLVNVRKKKELAGFLTFGCLVILAGAWLIWSTMNHQALSGSQENHFSGFSPSVLFWDEEIHSWADDWNLDPLLIATVMQIESCGNPNVTSPAGAQGLFQVMPYHFEFGEEMLDPQTNAARGLSYLSRSYKLSESDIGRTLAGYNGGHGQIGLEAALWPEETQRYVFWGTGIYEDAQTNNLDLPTLTAWLNAGGQHLCNLAEVQLGIDN